MKKSIRIRLCLSATRLSLSPSLSRSPLVLSSFTRIRICNTDEDNDVKRARVCCFSNLLSFSFVHSFNLFVYALNIAANSLLTYIFSFFFFISAEYARVRRPKFHSNLYIYIHVLNANIYSLLEFSSFFLCSSVDLTI